MLSIFDFSDTVQICTGPAYLVFNRCGDRAVSTGEGYLKCLRPRGEGPCYTFDAVQCRLSLGAQKKDEYKEMNSRIRLFSAIRKRDFSN